MGWNKLAIAQKREEPLLDDTMLQRGIMLSVAIMIATSSFLVGIMYERRTNPANSVELESFWQVWEIIDEDFYGDLPDAESRKYGAINGLVSSLNDPHTSYAPPEQAEAQRQQIAGHFSGIGVTIETIEDRGVRYVRVMRVIPNNPAAKAGIKPGDIFYAVNGNSTRGWDTGTLSGQVLGEIGTTVKLTMYRPSTDSTYDVEIKRAMIEVPTVFSRVLEEEGAESIGVIEFNRFSSVVADQMEEQLQGLLDSGVSAIILDLRDNGGGLLDQAVQVSDLFLGEGVILTQRSRNGEEEVFRSVDGDIGEDIPLIVLVNTQTASASEVVASALQDRERAIIVGQNTYGKGVVQNVYNLADSSQLRITAAAWFSPNGRAVNGQGLNPDAGVNLYAGEQLRTGDEPVDPYLEVALECLRDQCPEDAINNSGNMQRDERDAGKN